jgi:hypothetical protein
MFSTSQSVTDVGDQRPAVTALSDAKFARGTMEQGVTP